MLFSPGFHNLQARRPHLRKTCLLYTSDAADE